MGKKKNKKKRKPIEKRKWFKRKWRGDPLYWKYMSNEDLQQMGDEEAYQAFHYMRKGNTRAELSVYIDKAPAFISLLMAQSELFADAIYRGEELNKTADLKNLRKMMKDKDANAALVKLYFNEVYGITDRVEKDTTSTQPIVNLTFTTRETINPGEEDYVEPEKAEDKEEL